MILAGAKEFFSFNLYLRINFTMKLTYLLAKMAQRWLTIGMSKSRGLVLTSIIYRIVILGMEKRVTSVLKEMSQTFRWPVDKALSQSLINWPPLVAHFSRAMLVHFVQMMPPRWGTTPWRFSSSMHRMKATKLSIQEWSQREKTKKQFIKMRKYQNCRATLNLRSSFFS